MEESLPFYENLIKFNKLKNQVNEKEKEYLKFLKNPLLVFLDDLYEDVQLVCEKITIRLNQRRNLNNNILKHGINNYEFKLKNCKKEENVQLSETRNFLKRVGDLAN